ncbi:MAG: Cof-type HAD-IIB family hydrolase [Bradyrhizobium sp.]
MTAARRMPAVKISAVVSDVDGTLVTDDKILTERAQAAAAELRAAGIPFAIISSRPPRGMRMLLEPLGITTPIGAFNGGVIATSSLVTISEHLLPRDVAQHAVDMRAAQGAAPWLFCGQDWLVRRADGPYIARERRTVGFEPTVVDDFGPFLGKAAKIVGVSADFERLAQCERELQAALAGQATVALSQPYYLDITHSLANKGEALSVIAELLSVPLAEIAVIGDGRNDVAMFKRSGLSIAMGNASAEVRQAADFVTGSNSEDGFAHAVENFILGSHRPNASAVPVREGSPA